MSFKSHLAQEFALPSHLPALSPSSLGVAGNRCPFGEAMDKTEGDVGEGRVGPSGPRCQLALDQAGVRRPGLWPEKPDCQTMGHWRWACGRPWAYGQCLLEESSLRPASGGAPR